MKIFDDDDPRVKDGTYDVEGYKPGERARIAKAAARRRAAQQRCDHKFVDSRCCLKCGWVPRTEP